MALHVLKMALRDGGVNVALAGRNVDKVKKFAKGILDEITSSWGKERRTSVFREAHKLYEVVEADAKKPAQMLNLARSTKVLVACAGTLLCLFVSLLFKLKHTHTNT